MFEEDSELYGEFGELILNFLNITTGGRVESFSPTDDADEVWSLPPQFVPSIIMRDVSTPDLAIGIVWFGVMDGKPCVAEQNASPIVFYRKVD